MAWIGKCIDSIARHHEPCKNTMLVMVGQKELMPGQMPGYGYASVYNELPRSSRRVC